MPARRVPPISRATVTSATPAGWSPSAPRAGARWPGTAAESRSRRIEGTSARGRRSHSSGPMNPISWVPSRGTDSAIQDALLGVRSAPSVSRRARHLTPLPATHWRATPAGQHDRPSSLRDIPVVPGASPDFHDQQISRSRTARRRGRISARLGKAIARFGQADSGGRAGPARSSVRSLVAQAGPDSQLARQHPQSAGPGARERAPLVARERGQRLVGPHDLVGRRFQHLDTSPLRPSRSSPPCAHRRRRQIYPDARPTCSTATCPLAQLTTARRFATRLAPLSHSRSAAAP